MASRQLPTAVPVLIAGGGPVGLTLAALLASFGIKSLVLEADSTFCSGSRAICISRRSQEILGWVGADQPLREKGIAWVGGRSYFRNAEVLHFEMPSEPSERFAPMLNIQQYYMEQFAHDAAQRYADAVDIRFDARVVQVRRASAQSAQALPVSVDIEMDGGIRTVQAAWLIACDGGRSVVREQLGLSLQGVQYEGRYVIVDIEQKTRRTVERLAWFDPPSNPGSTILMHRQPDDVWRIDYQLADDEDSAAAVRPDNVLPRVQSHLDMIGENEPWRPLWISIYNAKALTLDSYRHGRVLFAGDAAHLLPIFGVRGLNSGLDDAGNLAWKLAAVIKGQADAALLDSYSDERVGAARQNMAYGAKSTEFMAPPNFAFRLMREAVLRLALKHPELRSLINPRQSMPVEYGASPLNVIDRDRAHLPDRAAPGAPAPEASVLGAGSSTHLTQLFGHTFVALYFGDAADAATAATALGALGLDNVAWHVVAQHGVTPGGAESAVPVTSHLLVDVAGEAWQRYGAQPGTLYLIRPDGYVLARWLRPGQADLRDALAPFHLRGQRR